MKTKLIPFFLILFILPVTNGCKDNIANSKTANRTIPIIDYVFINSYPHDITSFTEGFLIHNGSLFESTGGMKELPQTKSLFGIVDLTTGNIDTKVEIDKVKYFGEGITFLNGKVFQLIYNQKWKTYTSDDLGFTPYYFANIEFNSKNQLCGAIDYSLSSTMGHSGPQVFIFNGVTAEQLNFDNITLVKSLTIDIEDNIWCANYGGYAVYNGEKWAVDDSTFKDASVFAIEQAKDNKIWIGTGKGIYINE